MPGRAALMTPGQAYEMAGSRWNVPLGVLTNKKALDMAFQNHIWEMQKQAAQLASGEKIAGMRTQSAEDIAAMKGDKATPENQAKAALQQWIKAQGPLLDLTTPEGLQQVQSTYKMFLGMFGGTEAAAGAADLAAGNTNVNPSGKTFAPEQPSMFVPFGSPDSRAANPTNPVDKLAGMVTGKGGKKTPGRAPMANPGEQTATNPKTGERMVYRNGQWQPLK